MKAYKSGLSESLSVAVEGLLRESTYDNWDPAVDS